MPVDDRILLGRITGASGIRGEVIVHSFAAEPSDVAAYGALTDKTGQRTFKLKVFSVLGIVDDHDVGRGTPFLKERNVKQQFDNIFRGLVAKIIFLFIHQLNK